MESRHLYTLKWTQPYSTEKERPYLRQLHEAAERSIEAQVSRNDCPQAKLIIERIRHASKS
jgi:hypothetical protein